MKKSFEIFVLILALASAARAATGTIIGGLAKNATTSRPLAGAEVELVRPNADNTRVKLDSVRSDAGGRFAFPARQYPDDELLMVTINHGGFDYWTVAWDGGHKLRNVGINVEPGKLDLPVYDTTNQPVPLDFQVHHLAIKSQANGLGCIERIVVENPSKKTFMGIGPRKITLLLNLPPAARNVRLDPKIADAKLVETPNGWGVIRPITPDAYGVRQAIIINYEIAWPSIFPWAKKIDLSREIAYPTKFFFVNRVTDDKALQITAPALSADQNAPVPIDGKTETRIINSIGAPMMPTPALEAGRSLQITAARPVSGIFWGFAGLTVALCLFLPVALMKPRRSSAANALKSSEPSVTGSVLVPTSSHGATNLSAFASHGVGTGFALKGANQELIQKIADLDDLRDAGGIDETTYQSQRAAWKQLLLESFGSPPQ